MYARVKKRVLALSAAQQVVAAAAVLIAGSVAMLGVLATSWTEDAITHNTASVAAQYLERSITPNIQQLEEADTLSVEQQQTLHKAVNDGFSRSNIVYLQIWNPTGTIVYSTMPKMVGTKYPLSENFKRALNGQVSAEFDNPPHVTDDGDGKPKQRLLEIYWPLRDLANERIIAVAEFYVKGDILYQSIWKFRTYSWSIRLWLIFVVIFAFSLLVRRATKIIASQQAQLQNRIEELQELLRVNEELRSSLFDTSINITEVSELMAQRLGADLHDGPAQLLTYVLMRFDRCLDQIQAQTDASKVSELRSMRTMLEDTLREIRSLSEGLCLPGLNGMTLEETLQLAVSHHKEKTNTEVAVEISDLPKTLDHNLKTCVYRLVQEGLANAFHHAGAVGQAVRAEWGECLKITVSDQGPGFSLERTQGRLGLFGLRARVEACGGTFKIVSDQGKGVTLAAVFDVR